MLVKELVEYGQVQYHITVIKYRVQAFFDNGHFVSFKVERKELSLLHICKTVQLGKIGIPSGAAFSRSDLGEGQLRCSPQTDPHTAFLCCLR